MEMNCPHFSSTCVHNNVMNCLVIDQAFLEVVYPVSSVLGIFCYCQFFTFVVEFLLLD